MTDKERQSIVEAAQQHAVESARAQGLPAVVSDPDALRQVATLIAPRTDRKAA